MQDVLLQPNFCNYYYIPSFNNVGAVMRKVCVGGSLFITTGSDVVVAVSPKDNFTIPSESMRLTCACCNRLKNVDKTREKEQCFKNKEQNFRSTSFKVFADPLAHATKDKRT